ncbi:MAG: ParB/RepB/Spo0J family partition protein [Pseudomonadota bacterium]
MFDAKSKDGLALGARWVFTPGAKPLVETTTSDAAARDLGAGGETVRAVPLALIEIPSERRLRANHQLIEDLCRSIERRGLLSPVRVQPLNEDGKYKALVGVYRMLAHEKLGRAAISAIVTYGDPVDLELDEIEENLVRRELCVVERAAMLHRQKQLYLLRHPQTKRGTAGGLARQGQQPTTVSFAAAATSMGSKRLAERLLQIGAALPAELVTRLSETPIANNQAQLLQLARMPADVRAEAAVLIADGAARTVDEAKRAASGASEARPAPRMKEARVLLIAGKNGYSGIASLLGHNIEVFVSREFLHVDLEDRGSTAPIIVRTEDDELLRLEDFESVVKAVLAELPAEAANDVTTKNFRVHILPLSGVASGELVIRSPDAADIQVNMNWFTPNCEPGALYELTAHSDNVRQIGVSGKPTRGAFKIALRRFLGHRVFRTTHGHVVANAILLHRQKR